MPNNLETMQGNLETVKKYFKNCVDGKNTDLIDDYFDENVIIHRPDFPDPLVGTAIFKRLLREAVIDRYDSINTTFQREIVDQDHVVVALTHFATGPNTWNGFDVTGKNLSWTSLTYFQFNLKGKIIEEIVERNELNMARQLGLVNF